jgi:hypothetical protein
MLPRSGTGDFKPYNDTLLVQSWCLQYEAAGMESSVQWLPGNRDGLQHLLRTD